MKQLSSSPARPTAPGAAFDTNRPRQTVRDWASRRLRLALGLCALLLAGAAPARAQTQTFNFTNGTQSYTVPAGVTKLNVTAIGGGGSGNGGSSSSGARVDATVPVTPGEVLTVVVGGAPNYNTNVGGYNGGGNGSNNNSGGGGSTDLRRTGTSTGDYLTGRNALLVAGGGGGGNGTNVGGSGGTPAGSSGGGSFGGGGASQNGPGAAGGSAGAGSNATGGYGVNGGGGGGGGYYGGGGASKSSFSSTASGGGGGSSWVLAAGSGVSYATSGALYGSLAITPTPPSISGFSPATGTFGITVTISGDFVNGATGVLFNGIAASSFTLVNSTTITAVVPSSTTGPISVVGAGGTGTSASNFTPIYLQVTGLSPARHALAAAPGTTVGLTFNQAPTAASASGIRVLSSQYKGRRTASAAVSGNTATLTLSGGSFRPGEVVQVSLPSTVQSSGGTRALAQVYQFTTAATGTGVGNFYGGADPVVGSTPARVVPADVDGDGDLDIIVTAVAFNNSGPNTAYVRLNSGGTFSGGSDVTVGGSPAGLAVGDVDGDGDFDIVTANDNANTASVRLNSGGTFSGTQEVSVGAGPSSVVLGDVDGDGDLDLVTANYNHGNGSNTASVRLNGGDASGSNTGVFSAGSNPTVLNNANGVAMGDVDNDGDLDLLTYNFGNTVNVRLNNGGGTFAGGTTFTVVGLVSSLVLGDVNGDGYLDAVTADYNNNTASVRLNNGSGTFAGGSDPGFGGLVSNVVLGDVDADGDLDLVANNGSQNNAVLVSVRLNNGSGTFAGGSDFNLGGFPYGMALADVDGDNDLDLLAANYSGSGTVNVRLNQVAAPTITSFSPTSGVLGASITITGTNFTGTTAVTFNGTTAPSFVVNSATQITVSVPAAATSGLITVTAPGGTATSSAGFTVIRPPVISSFTPGSGPVGQSVTITGTDLTGATAVSLNGTAGTITGTPTATGLTFTVAAGSASGPITLATPMGTAASAANPVLRLQATGGTSSDNTAYLDQVEILNAMSGAIVAGGISNGSFETGAPAGNLTNPGAAVTPWTFGGSARLSTMTSAFGPPAPPDGSAHIVVLQLSGCYVEQALSLGPGTYQVRFQLAQRQCCVTPYDQGITVLINGVAVGTSLTTSSAGYVGLVSAPFTVSAAGTFTVIPPPTLTAVAPNPGGLGQSITLTGTNLGSPTALTINGANALGNIISNTSTSLVVRVPATATASGTVSITTAAGTAALAFTVMAPPGNALAFDGVDDYVSMPASTPVPVGNAAYTVEAWVNPNSMSLGSILGWGNYGTTNQANGLSLNTAGLINYWWGNDLQVATPSLVGHWHHVAATYDGTTRTLYLDGVAIGADVPGVHAVPNANNLRIGSNSNGTFTYLNGRLDEVRVYSVALTPAQLAADMTSTAATVPASLVLYYNLDQGTPATASTGNNAGLTTVYDLTSATPGTLTNFALASGNTTSNYVESYALVVPIATAVSARTATGFTANWTAPAVGTVDNGYRLDVSTTSNFSSPITGSPFTVSSGTSQAVTGLNASATYYYRVRADKTSVTGQGAYSNTMTVVPPSSLSCSAAANNALNFDGGSDYVHSTSTLPNTGEFTIETWVNPATLPGGFSGLLLSDNFPAGAMHWQFNNSILEFTINGNSPSDQFASFTVPTGSWSHVAVVYSASARTAKFYLNGALQNTTSYTTATAVAALPYSVGGWLSGGPQRLLNGSLNELRVWNVARTDAQVLASYNQALPAQTGLAILHSFDQGTAGGTNTGVNTLNDDSGTGHTGTLNSFALTGATSNWVAGNTLAYTLGLTSFSPANGSAGGTVTLTGSGFTGVTAVRFNGTAATSFTVVNGSTITAVIPAGATSGPITVTGPCGTVTSSASFTVCPAPVAVAQNVGVTLDVNGNATLAATTVNNGSTANCGPAAAAALSISPSSFSCTDAVPATVASALVFNGSTQYVEGTNASLPLGNAARTIEAWVYPTAASANGIVFNYGTPNNNQRSGILLSNGNLYYVGENNDLRGNIALTVNAWNHVAATYDGTTLKLYVNGVLDVSSNPGAFNTTGTVWRIARRSYPDTGEFLTGRVDEVRVWSGARTATQVNANKGVGLPGGSAGLVGYYRLNEGSGTTTADATASASTGTLYNAPTWTTAAAPVVNGVPATLTVTDASGVTSTAPAVVTVSVPATPTTTWNGSASTSWTDCANWSFGKVPDAATNVVIPTGKPRYPSLPAGTYPTLNLTLANGATLATAGGATLQVSGDWTNNGTATLAGPVTFTGSAATQTLGGTAATNFTTLTVNKASGTVQLAQNLPIGIGLMMTSGTLSTTAGYYVQLGSTATLSETDASYVTGAVRTTRTLAPGTTEAFGGLGLTLTPATGSTAPGLTPVVRTTGTALTGVNGHVGITRYFDIQPTVNTGLNVTMVFSYFAHELNGIPTANLALFKSVSGTSGPWAWQRPTMPGTNTITKTGLADFSVWTLGNSASPLPVELTDFTAKAQGDAAVALAWTTASEKNSAFFEVERSLNGMAFERIGTVAAAGTSTVARAYALTDAKLPTVNVLYYRLRQVDLDGTASYSPVRTVTLSAKAATLALFPNPTHAATVLTGAVPGTQVEVLDAVGRVVVSTTAAADGSAALRLPAGLASGVYVVRAGAQSRRLVVE